ncbi:MAG TPA: DUF5103 domain-containing protein [Bacteroidales bacterium]|nr:DUF5103 domain-containing protein [Bacteroidales bacterium]
MKRFIPALSLLLITLVSAAAGIPAENRVYDPELKSVQVFREGSEMQLPVITLGSDQSLTIRFDDLSPELKRFRYTILHCESDWSLSSDLIPADYIDGFREENIETYRYSYNTTTRYTHYTASFPTANMRPKLSGNYLLVVYDDDISHISFSCRFMVAEITAVVAEGRVVQPAAGASHFDRQQVDFVLNLGGFTINDVERELRVVMMQNGRWDNALYLSRPRFTRPGQLDYRYDESITFPGGNQFRWFDTKSLQYQSERIARISFDTAWQVLLLPDIPRPFKQYVSTDKDLNGWYFIKSEDHADDSQIEADYAWVHFFLAFPARLTTGSFHVAGELTGWRLDESNRMTFDPDRKGYSLSLLLKQGYYNYTYLLKTDDKTPADESATEGSHWDTENDYHILVYYHATGAQYDRLISVNTINSLTP